MGWRYLSFRLTYELKRRLGWLKRQYPTHPAPQEFITLADWRKSAPAFFFFDRSAISVEKKRAPQLETMLEGFRKGKLRFFSSEIYEIGTDYDWLTNPENGYRYDNQKHWTVIPDFSTEAGDIKWVWEKSRFSYLYGLIRYDYHFEEDLSETVFSEIDSWIAANPINQGPNWRCSQEISLRVLNWTFALYYYRNSDTLTEERFQRVLHCIYWQLKHVAANINFSRIAVRNNHALTETLMLYLGGNLFPFFPESKQWVKQGKRWFVEEIDYQIYEDGTFLQFSHNYHRVAVQLLSWALYLCDAWGDSWPEVVYDRARKSVAYLNACMAGNEGALPNYGANDGALFFPLSSADYRDFRPSLNALYYYFNRQDLYHIITVKEEQQWYRGALQPKQAAGIELTHQKLQAFREGGYYLMRESEALTFIKCGRYRDRPSQADNLHLDIWWHGENILRDAGSYMYNTSEDLIRFFNGTKGHNTAGLGVFDQMKKGPRFIWLNWSQAEEAVLEEKEEYLVFYGRIRAFEEIGPNIFHERWVQKKKGKAKWLVTDRIIPTFGQPLRQYWHPNPDSAFKIHLSAVDEHQEKLPIQTQGGYYSGYYGQKEMAPTLVFETTGSEIRTEITLA